jgi:hypothetical protein
LKAQIVFKCLQLDHRVIGPGRASPSTTHHRYRAPPNAACDGLALRHPDQPAPTMRGLLFVAVLAVGPLPTRRAGMRSDDATLTATAWTQPATAASAEYKWPAIVVM